jgi:hypothetical protein
MPRNFLVQRTIVSFLPSVLFFGFLMSSALAASDQIASSKEKAGLQKEVLGLFQARCIKCHGPQKAKAELNLSSGDTIARGSNNGPVIHPGKLADSVLWQMVQEGKMPPKSPLPENERAIIRRWIEQGAPGLPQVKADTASSHWAFRSLTRVAHPAVQHPEHARTAIDRYIEAVLEKKNLQLGPEADRAALLRRVSFDLTGLPPTLPEIDAFTMDSSRDAYERMIERYLASPLYGERWGKYWLEAAGYADSNGYFSADSDRPLAYRYRDYVIRSFNADKPYDRFVFEQLAGDELAGYVQGADVTGDALELLTATHFLRNAPDGTGESDGNPDEVRIDRFTVLEGNLQVTMSCLLGITIQCARCHAHKFEPIKHDEYYRLQAILYPVYCPDRWVKPDERVAIIGTRAQREEHRRRTEWVDQQIKALQTSLETITESFQKQILDEHYPSLDATKRTAVLNALKTEEAKRNREQRNLLKAYPEAPKITADSLAKRFAEYAAVRDPLQKAVAAREKDRPSPLDKLAVFVEADPNPPVHHVLLRGQHNAPGPEVQPGVPAAFCTPENAYRIDPRPAGRISSGRRTAFARWLTSPTNPLLARVMINRIWQHHFGVGIVATSNNLGQSGARPSHPELLDYLAAEFIRSGWSIKAIHRLILKSAVYKQSSALREEAHEIDPENRLLWRYPLRRLDAEAIRDAMLAVAGELDCHMGGPYVPTQRLSEGNVEVDESRPDARRRSVYLQQRRTQVATLLELFDAPAVVSNCTFRNTSTVPLQSLALLNSHFARARAQTFAARLEREAGQSTEPRITTSFRLACGRDPGSEERAAAERFLAAQQKLYKEYKDGNDGAWVDYCQMVLASNAFLYVE